MDPESALYCKRFYRLMDAADVPMMEQHQWASGQFHLNLVGEMGRAMVVEASTNLTDWLPIATKILGSDLIPFTDPQSVQYPQRFYRLFKPKDQTMNCMERNAEQKRLAREIFADALEKVPDASGNLGSAACSSFMLICTDPSPLRGGSVLASRLGLFPVSANVPARRLASTPSVMLPAELTGFPSFTANTFRPGCWIHASRAHRFLPGRLLGFQASRSSSTIRPGPTPNPAESSRAWISPPAHRPRLLHSLSP